MRPLALASLLPWLLLLPACPDGRGGDDDDGGGGDDDDDASEDDRPVLPDPGAAQDDWGSQLFSEEDACCGTPEDAYPVGTVTMDAGYIQGVIDSGLRFFYVFRSASSLDSFSFPLAFDEVHLHDGDGLRFGDEVQPSETGDWSVTWDVEGDHVYAIEIASSFEGFF